VLLVFALIGRAQVVAAERRGREVPLPAPRAAEGQARGA
jgi:hypothetical protein